ncbi:MAG TPA: D-alanyl-D-alanine carboxypeptidase/D-alanyl-D-alanine-endopeptidase, partial [Longimicrobiales bacterium]|nr:D-alanyl-D-alanine carboxypeptidase/D-alanyl-D-alanine-endopeptidase [Longimicrobiales bacterium]
RSDSLGAVLPRILRPSDNQAAESLLRTVGRVEGDEGSTEEGLQVLEETLTGWGVEPGAVRLADGSGLSRYDEVTPAALVRVLRTMWRSPHHEILRRALPAPEEWGTLRGRFEGTPAVAALRAKTGSLSSVRGLAGYVEDGDGETLIFALLIQGYDAPGGTATALRDLLVEQLSLFHRRVDPGWPEYRDGG